METIPTRQTIQYSMARATQAQIVEHLETCSGQFRPPLDDRVDLPTYAEKLFTRAATFEAWHDRRLVGLVASYLNSETQPASAFVSNVSVLSAYRSQGIARSLMVHCHREVERRDIRTIALEVSAENVPAINLYSKLGYVMSTTEGSKVLMQFEWGTDR